MQERTGAEPIVPSGIHWRAGLVWIGPVLVSIGFVAERMWHSLPAPRAAETIVLAVVSLCAASIVRAIFRTSLATAIALVFTAALICLVGIIESIAVLFVVVAAASVGWLLNDRRMDAPAIIAGVASLAGLIGWLLPFRLHYPLVYFLLLIAPIVAARRGVVDSARTWHRFWRDAVAESPRIAAFAVTVTGLASAACWLPTLQYDDLAYHLSLPTQLSALHYYRMDVTSQFWALAPWSGDIVQALPHVLTGRDARGGVDACWLLATAVLAWQLARQLGASPRFCWLTTATVASQPLLASLAGGMQAELPATAATLALGVIATSPEKTARRVIPFALIAGFLIALKTGFVALVLPLLLVSIRHRSRSARWLDVGVGVAAFLFASASSYVYASLVTGDPFFPLFTQIFSSAFPVAVSDARWSAPVDAAILWRLTFDTARYLEGWNGAAGFTLLGWFGASGLALTLRATRGIAVCAIIAFVAAIVTVHYFRYAFPALVLMTPAAFAACAQVMPSLRFTIIAMTLIMLNLAYQSCSYWTLHVGAIKQRVLAGDDAVIDRLTPERALLKTVRERDGDANVLLCSPGAVAGAEHAGRAFVTTHYDVELEQRRIQADEDASGERWRELFDYTDAMYAIVTAKSTALSAALGDAKLVRDINCTQLWALSRTRGDDRLWFARDQARAHFWSARSIAQ